jgi:hypothetical protein
VLQLHKYLFLYIPLLIAIVCSTIAYTFQSHDSVSYQYKITQKTSDGLKAYTKFTGKQFLIINNDPFDWMDVTVAVHAKQIENQVVSQSAESDELILVVPRIRSGGM